jgi:hypothetical protein
MYLGIKGAHGTKRRADLVSQVKEGGVKSVASI